MLHEWLHEWILIWFEWVEHWGYLGIFVLMAMESSILPVPSEVVMPPAAFWASQGRLDFTLVVVAGTLGSYVGSAISYYLGQKLGEPVIRKWGRYVFINDQKMDRAKEWVQVYGVVGIFFARLLPVIRHLISIPAGLCHMSFWRFSVTTLIGSALWCWILSWYGSVLLGSSPQLLQSPDEMVTVLKAQFFPFVGGVLGLTVLFGIMVWMREKSKARVARAIK